MKKAKIYIDGIVGFTRGGNMVAEDGDGGLHHVAWKDQADLKEGDRISFIPRRYRRKSYVSRMLLRP